MRIIMFLLAISLTAITAFGQDLTGQWSGNLDASGTKLRLVFNIAKTDTGYTATLDSPDQGAKGIPLTSFSFANASLKMENSVVGFSYEGVLNKDNVIVGNFSQGGQVFPLELVRKPVEKAKRPQEPLPPYPYYSEDITFENAKDKIELAGTLTLPTKEGRFPAVVLITGSGPQNRNEEILEHKPFLVLADFLTRNGIAVLRFDDRGVGGSKGSFGTATSLDFSYDAEAAVTYLRTRKEIDKRKIGLIGHSEGGMIAPMIAARSGNIAFILLLAGPGVSGKELLLLQKGLIERRSDVPEPSVQRGQKIFGEAYDIVIRSTSVETLKAELADHLKRAFSTGPKSDVPEPSKLDEVVTPIVNRLTSPWMVYFIKYDPAIALSKVKCPVLAVNGSNDLQVPSTVDLAAIKAALTKAGNKRVTTIEFPGLNHLFQESATGLPSEYGKIEQTFSPAALSEITNWIKKLVK